MKTIRYYSLILLPLMALFSAPLFSASDKNESIFYHFSDYSNVKSSPYIYSQWPLGRETVSHCMIFSGDSLFVPESKIGQFYRDTAWENTTKTEYLYDYKGRNNENHYYQWDVNHWSNKFIKTIYNYNSDGDVESYLFQTCWDTGSTVNNESRSLYEYFENKLFICRTNQNWENDQWVNSSRYEERFNSFGSWLSVLFLTYKNGNTLDTSARYIYEYDNEGRILKEEDFQYFSKYHQKIEYSYSTGTEADTVTRLTYSRLDTGTAYNIKDVSIYGKSGLLKEVRFYNDTATNAFRIITCSYNGNEKLIKKQTVFWHNNAWCDGASDEYYYDSDGNLIKELNVFVGAIYSDYIIRDSSRTFYNYKQISSAEERISKPGNNIDIFPDPASDYIVFSTTGEQEFEIYNSFGNLVISSRTNDRIDISSLIPGAYYVRINNKVKSFIKK